jgi:hypothetical protein
LTVYRGILSGSSYGRSACGWEALDTRMFVL